MKNISFNYKIFTVVVLALVLAGNISAVSAKSDKTPGRSYSNYEWGKKYEGSKLDDKYKANGDSVEQVDIVHYYKSKNGQSAKISGGVASCYKLLGVKWLGTPVNYLINPVNVDGLSDSFVISAISAGAEAWDNATSRELFNNAYGIDYSAQYGLRDNKNSIVFGDYPNAGVIGITSIWFTRQGKQIVEFDTLFNNAFHWGDAAVDPTKMDLQNIATHEIGHGVGMGDLYNSVCSPVTMYGYSSEGDIAKRTLEAADVAGLRLMYGI